MLGNIRKTANSFIMRILFFMIAFAFVSWGIKDILNGTYNTDIVSFSHAKNVTREDFLKAKSIEINAIQKQMGINLSEDEIKQLNIDNQIIRRLISNNILDYLLTYYDFDLSDNMVKELVKKSPMFKNKQGVFDLKIFKTYFQNSYINEEKYLLHFKEKVLKNFFINVFLEGFYVPKVMTDNIVDYMSEKREVELLQVNLQNKPKNLKTPSPSEEELKKFYQDNQQLFMVSEKRSFSYIKISNQNLLKKINITKDDVWEFYNENKEEFAAQNFDTIYQQLYDLLQNQKVDEFNMELAKNLEDAVASGTTLVEIAEKYELPLQNVNSISYDELTENKTIAENIDVIFELKEGELSYPIESTDKNYLVLVELKEIIPSKIPEFSTIIKEVKNAWTKKYLADYNFKTMQSLASEYKLDRESIGSFDTNIRVTKQSYIRSEIENNIELTPEMFLSIFKTKLGNNTPVFQIGEKLYFAHIKSISSDKSTAKNIYMNSEQNIVNSIKNSLIEELINYAMKQNHIKITAFN